MNPAKFQKLINLAEERLGASIVACSDDFFAAADNLVKPGRGIFIEGKFTENGKWMDGWESRRKRVPGHDWCILKLGLSGIVEGVDIDTNHFLGNHPPFASIEGACVDQDPVESDWTEILEKSHLDPGSQNLFKITHETRLTHLRLNIFPDGGVARLKVYGQVQPDWDKVALSEVFDLVSVENGGQVLGCNDMFFSSKDNLIMPNRGANMGDGWETKRKRVPGHDWAILQLGKPGVIRKLEIDTHHFKGNYPDRFSLEFIDLPDAQLEVLRDSDAWELLVEETKLEADKQHYIDIAQKNKRRCSHVRLNIFPDGGVSRLRLLGSLD